MGTASPRVETRPIPGFAHYYASSDGHVYSDRKKSMLNEFVNSCGYLKVGIWDGTKKSQEYVHRLVARAFLPNPNGLPQVNHKDENKRNNSVDNLEWCSPRYNMVYGRAPGIRAAKRSIPVLCAETGKVYGSMREASKDTGAHACSISLCARGINKTANGLHWEFTGGEHVYSGADTRRAG